MATEKLSGLRILLVEDEFLIALLVEEILKAQGCKVIGPCSTVEEALDYAGRFDIDLAILDVNLRGEKVYPVAEKLQDRHIPFLLLSGYGQTAIPSNHKDWQVFSKPFHIEDLLNVITLRILTRPHHHKHLGK